MSSTAMRPRPAPRASAFGASARARFPGKARFGSLVPRSRVSARASNATQGSATSTAAGATDATYAGRRVVLTREEGKNGDMRARLSVRGIEVLEMPLIETAAGADAAALPAALADAAGWDWVCITSPEAAKVFLRGWREAGEPDVPIATVGKGTAKVLKGEYARGALTREAFTPSKADAATLAGELPLTAKSARVLYPASAKAASTLQEGLRSRGARVTRLNTYSTEKVSAVDADAMALALAADVVTFGSPSAVKAWLALSGLADEEGRGAHPLYACIGGTSARACDKVGLPGVLFPESPGVDGWERVVLDALDSLP
jgi:uroporphyrinogen-III synthase